MILGFAMTLGMCIRSNVLCVMWHVVYAVYLDVGCGSHAWIKGMGGVYGDILHGMWWVRNVEQLHAPTGAHLATARDMLQAQLQKVARGEGPGWLEFNGQIVTGAWYGM